MIIIGHEKFNKKINELLPDEEWREINYYGIHTNYEISNMGRVKSLGFSGNGYHVNRERILKPIEIGNYLAVTIYANGKPIREYIHRLVAMAFIPVPDELIRQGYTMKTLEVNHIMSGVEYKHDNRVTNLEWVTGSINKIHDYNTGIRNRGEHSHLATKNKEYQIHNVCRLLEENVYTVDKISELTGVKSGEIYDILYGNSWTHVSSQYNVQNYTPKNRKYSDEILNAISEYRMNGSSISEISDELSLPYKTVWYLIKHKIQQS